MAEKPTCKKCNLAHWPFKKCDEAVAANEREAELAAERDSKKVIPVPRHDPAPRPGLITYRQVGANRFVKVRD